MRPEQGRLHPLPKRWHQLGAGQRSCNRGAWIPRRWFARACSIPPGGQPGWSDRRSGTLAACRWSTQQHKPRNQPWEFVNLVLLAVSQKGTNFILRAFIIMTAVSCIRFEHIQRSTWTAHHESWPEFWCCQGKKRIRGARPGYAWCMPEVALQGFS